MQPDPHKQAPVAQAFRMKSFLLMFFMVLYRLVECKVKFI